MNWLIDSDVLIEGERGDARFLAWLNRPQGDAVAVSDGVVGEFLLGVHAVSDAGRSILIVMLAALAADVATLVGGKVTADQQVRPTDEW